MGSQNFDWRALSHIHELGLRVTDLDRANTLGGLFEMDWAQGKTVGSNHVVSPSRKVSEVRNANDLQVVGAPAYQLPADIGYSLDAITNLLAKAQANKTVHIQVMTFSSNVNATHDQWLVLDNAIRAAAAKGAKVQLMVDVSDLKKGREDLTALAKVKNVEVRSVTIPAFSEGPIPFARLIHSKYAVVEGAGAWIGSENWTRSYFENTRDVGFLTTDSSLATLIDSVFSKVWNSAYITKVGS